MAGLLHQAHIHSMTQGQRLPGNVSLSSGTSIFYHLHCGWCFFNASARGSALLWRCWTVWILYERLHPAHSPHRRGIFTKLGSGGDRGEPGCPIDTRSLLDGVKEDFQLVDGRRDGDRWRLVIGCDPWGEQRLSKGKNSKIHRSSGFAIHGWCCCILVSGSLHTEVLFWSLGQMQLNQSINKSIVLSDNCS